MYLPLCFAQASLKGDWQTKGSLNDTLTMICGSYTDLTAYLSRNYDFKDTTYYWHFLGHDSLHVEYAIRSCQIIPLEKPDTIRVVALMPVESQETSKQKKKHQKDEQLIEESKYEVVTTRQLRLSLWDVERGTWTMKNNTLQISGTKSFNGSYLIVKDSSGSVRLIRSSR